MLTLLLPKKLNYRDKDIIKIRFRDNSSPIVLISKYCFAFCSFQNSSPNDDHILLGELGEGVIIMKLLPGASSHPSLTLMA